MDAYRKTILKRLIDDRFQGSRQSFMDAAALSKGRVAQLLDPDMPFGERAARALVAKLGLADGFFERGAEALRYPGGMGSTGGGIQVVHDEALAKVYPFPIGPGSNVGPATAVRGGDVPLISWVQAGSWNDAQDPLQPGDAEDWLPCSVRHGGGTYALRVRGDSMTAPTGGGKTYPAGCIIFVDPEKRLPTNGQRIIAKLQGTDEVTFKVYKEEDGRRWLMPLNPQHEPIREPFDVLGTVILKQEEE